MLRFRHSALALAAITCMLFGGCADTITTPPPAATDFTPVLTDVAIWVILGTYADLDTRAGELQSAVTLLATNRTDAYLDAARTAWRNARSPWEQSEAFLFGPVDTKGIDPSIDSWPVNRVDLENVLASDAPLTKEYIDGLEGTLKGFHTIEYILFGVDGTRRAADLTDRELEYLQGVTASFKGATSLLRDSWDPSNANGERFTSQLANAGSTGSIYASEKDAMQELITGMIGICDEVANGKINDPYSQQDRTLEESQFSNNSNADFADNIRSVKNIYLGTYATLGGNGISTMVAPGNAALDTQIRSEIDAAIAAIGGMTPTFGEAIVSNPTAVESARAAIARLQLTLESKLLPYIQNL